MDNRYFSDDDIFLNTATRVPVFLCLDISGSMNRDNAISLLNEGIARFYDAIRRDERTVDSCEIAIVTFASEVKVAEDFSTINKKQPITFTAEGGTAMAHGVEKALDILEERKKAYKAAGLDYFQPWLVLITDGKPGDVEDIPAAQSRTKALIESNKLTIIPVVVGSDDNPEKFRSIMDVLNGFCPTPKAAHLKDLKFEKFFAWLGASISSVDELASNNDKLTIEVTAIKDWGEI